MAGFSAIKKERMYFLYLKIPLEVGFAYLPNCFSLFIGEGGEPEMEPLQLAKKEKLSSKPCSNSCAVFSRYSSTETGIR